MAKVAKKRRWTVYGRVFNGGSTARPRTIEPDKELLITEDASTLKIAGSEGPYGEPISTGVAVHLIRNMLDLIETSNAFLDKIEEKYLSFKQKDNSLGVDFTPEDTIALKFLRDLISKSMAITFDKSQILRIISQPGCEGIRFYQAVRDISKTEKVMTLVCVGLHENAHDLNYSIKPATSRTRVLNPDTTCESLVVDWAHPPGSTTVSPLDKKAINNMYVLLKMAQAAKPKKKA